MPAPVTLADAATNRRTRRYIEPTGTAGLFSCWTFQRPSDETYQRRATDVPERAAHAWLAGDDDALYPPAARPAPTRTVTVQLTVAQAAALAAHTAVAAPLAHRDLRAALDTLHTALTTGETA